MEMCWWSECFHRLAAFTRTRNPVIRMYDRIFQSVLMLTVLFACSITSVERTLAQSTWSPTRPPSTGNLVTPEKLQVDARRPVSNQASAAATLGGHKETREAVTLAGYSDSYVDDPTYASSPGCNCPECNPISHLGCTIPGCGCGTVLRGRGVWVGADYLLWSLQGMDLPPLVTSSPAGTLPANTGVLGLSTTRTLLSGTTDEDYRSGGRIRAGIWTDASRLVSWEGSYLALEKAGEQFSFSSNTTPNLAIPIFDTLLGAEAAVLIAQSSFLTGSIDVSTATELQAFEIVRRGRWCSDGYFNFDLLLGYKHGSLDDMLRVNQASRYSVAQGPIQAGTNITREDSFETENNFNGFLIGLERKHRWNGWMIGYTGKVSLGANQSRVVIDGRTRTTIPSGSSSTFAGGVLAQTTNIGAFQQDDFMFLPEFDFTLKRQLNDCTRIHCGYSVMYWSSAVRASDTISRRVSQLPPEPISGTAEPRFSWRDSGFLAHGFQFGLDYKF